MDKSKKNECSECKSTFIRQTDMIRHIKRFHSKKAEKLISDMEKITHTFKCDQCNKQFFHKKNLICHQKSHSSLLNSGVKIRKKCPLCDHVVTFKKDYYDHCREAHKILLDVEKKDFDSLDDFAKWKSEIEKSSNSKFVKEYGSTDKMTNYICGQSEYLVVDNGIEKPSSQTNKVNGFCPAGFRVMHEDNSKCSIYFVKTHICHQNKSLSFSKVDRSQSPDSKTSKVKKRRTSMSNEVENNKNHTDYQVGDISQSDSTCQRSSDKKKLLSKKIFSNKKKEMISNVLKTLNTISTMKELDAVQELINPIKPILEIIKKSYTNYIPKGKNTKLISKSKKLKHC